MLPQQNKIEYYQAQVKQLQDRIQDLQEQVRINKFEIDILSQRPSHTVASSSCQDFTRIEPVRDSFANKQKTLNESLEKRLSHALNTIENISSEKLMLQQLLDQATSDQKEQQDAFSQRIHQMQTHIQTLQQKLARQEHDTRFYDGLTGFVERLRFISSPSEASLAFQSLEQIWNNKIAMLNSQVEVVNREKEALLRLNTILNHKVVSLQAKLVMPNRNLGDFVDNSLKKLMIYFLEVQKKLLTGDQSDSDDENNIDLVAPEIRDLFPQRQNRIQKDHNVPHLDLLKVRPCMNLSVEKIDEQLIKRAAPVLPEAKIKMLKVELEYTRRQLTWALLQLRQQKDKRRSLQSLCEELEHRNKLLAESYSAILASGLYNPVVQNLNQEKEEVPRQPNITKSGGFMALNTIKDCIEHVRQLANQLNNNELLSQIQHENRKFDMGPKPTLKRSTSNPFLYMNERKEEVYTVRMQGNGDQGNRLEQTQFCMKKDSFEDEFEEINLDEVDHLN